MSRKLAGAALTLPVVLLAGYLALAPVPAEPVAWRAPPDAGHVGPHAVNDRLAALQQVGLGAEAGPEHVALGPDGRLYAAVASGRILRMNADGSAPEVWAETGGRVLGFDFDAQGRMIAADAMRGLVAIEPDAPRRIAVLADKVLLPGGEDPIRYANSVVVARDGRIYFTDSSRRFAPAQWGGTFPASVLDILEHSSTGRLLVHEPASGRTSVMVDGLCFANGVALSGDGRSVFVAETGEYRIWRVAREARGLDARALAASGGSAVAKPVLENLPGYPDNLMRGREGRIWVGFTKPRGPAVDKLADKPLLRKLTLRLPKSLWPVPPAYGHVAAFDEASGRIVADLQDPAGAYPETTGVLELADRLWVPSLHAPSLGWLPRGAAAL